MDAAAKERKEVTEILLGNLAFYELLNHENFQRICSVEESGRVRFGEIPVSTIPWDKYAQHVSVKCA